MSTLEHLKNEYSTGIEGVQLVPGETEGTWLSPTLDLSPIKKAISSGISWESDEQEQLFDYIEDSPSDFATGTLTDVAVGDEGLELAQTIGALDFDGIENVVTVPYMDLGLTNSITVEAWVKPDTVTKDMMFIGFNVAQTYFRVVFSKLFASIFTTSGQQTLGGVTTLVPDTYYHVAFTYDGSALTIYLNGEMDNSALRAGPTISSEHSVSRIGYWIDFDKRAFDGRISEVRIWNVVKNSSELKQNMYKSLVGNESGLLRYWKFNAGSGTTAIDSSGNGNDGTIVGATYTEDVPFEYYAPTGNRLTTLSLDTIKDVTGSTVNWTSTNPSTNNIINETEISTGVFDQTEHNLGVITLQYDTTWETLSGLTWEEV